MISGVTLKGLEVFEALAATGSVALASEQTGLSQPAVSQQMRNLETALDVDLLDHSRRPMILTPAGRSFLQRTQTVLSQLRLGQNELATMDLSHLSTLNLGVIDDFDNDLTPRLVTTLADSLTSCKFKLISAPSHEISAALIAEKLHMAVAASAGDTPKNVSEYHLVRDPYIVVAPRGARPLSDIMTALPFLRYDRDQLIGRQIDSHLARQGLTWPTRFEIGANLSLMALVARGVGWAITTPLGYMRAVRFHTEIEAHPVPFEPFSRRISLFAGADWAEHVPRDVARIMRLLLQDIVIDPALRQLPWMEGELRLLDG